MISFQQASALKEAGFPQKKYPHARYYITEDIMIDFQDISYIYSSNLPLNLQEEGYSGKHDFADQDKLVYQPTLEDLIGYGLYEKHIKDYVEKYLEANKDVQENSEKLCPPDSIKE